MVPLLKRRLHTISIKKWTTKSVRALEKGVKDAEIFLDPNTFSKDGTLLSECENFSKDGSKVAYQISERWFGWRKVSDGCHFKTNT
ncbi:MAG: hypothetical protein IPJ13_31880 [Saprospiraceae bacterium]|nr:hypothetical protein [Saprospiraceae bacterium]